MLEFAKNNLKNNFSKKINYIKSDLNDLSSTDNEFIKNAHISNLNLSLEEYSNYKNLLKEVYDIEFPDIEKTYQEILPDIKKYLNEK